MNYPLLFETQNALRNRIVREHNLDPGSKEFSDNLTLALFVEVGECANEWRGFKQWSKNRKPARTLHTTEGATIENAAFFKCDDADCGEYSYKEDFVSLIDEPDYEKCPKCHAGYAYAMRKKNPLLEEYVDGFHFVLEKGLEIELTTFEPTLVKVDDPGKMFRETYTLIAQFENAKNKHIKEFYYGMLFNHYLALGKALGFTTQEIEDAYFEKNKVNFKRQEDGY